MDEEDEFPNSVSYETSNLRNNENNTNTIKSPDQSYSIMKKNSASKSSVKKLNSASKDYVES